MPPNQAGIVTKRLRGKYSIHKPACPKPKMLTFSLMYSTRDKKNSPLPVQIQMDSFTYNFTSNTKFESF